MALSVLILMGVAGMLREPSPAVLLDSVSAVKFCYGLLQDTGVERGCELHGACHALFEMGADSCALVALGFREPTRGYSFFYRMGESRSELIQMRCDSYDWGVASQQTEDRVGADIVHLAPGRSDTDVTLIRLAGSGRPGPGVWVEGYFELLLPTPAGLDVVFAGSAKSWSTNSEGYLRQYEYRFEDVTRDGFRELLQEGAEYAFSVGDSSVSMEGPVEVSRCYYFEEGGFTE